MALSFDSTRPDVLAALFFVVGAIAGGLANLWAIARDTVACAARALNESQVRSSPWYQLLPIVGCFLSLGKSRFRGVPVGWRGLAVAVATGVLFAAYVLAAVRLQCQQVAEVRPDDFWKSARIISHLVLITLLVAATVTDLRDYVIPDSITVPGMIFGLAAAVLSGQLQMEHVWVDWNQEVPGITGPYIPGWLDAHRHWHGFAWSLAGGLDRRRTVCVREGFVGVHPAPRGARFWRRHAIGNDWDVYRMAADCLRLCAGSSVRPGLYGPTETRQPTKRTCLMDRFSRPRQLSSCFRGDGCGRQRGLSSDIR